MTATFVRRLHDLGWIEGRNIAIAYRWGEGRPDRYAAVAAEFVRLNVDVIVTGGSAVPLLKQATSVIPIVFVLATDPIGGGLVASLSHPGGNVTGSSNQGVDLASKRLELLREALPRLQRLAILAMAVSERPDIILMDFEMPVMDGWQATRRLKSTPGTSEIPIIGLSAHALAGEREKALAAGCDAFDTKPVEFERLVATVRRVFASCTHR